MFIISLFSHFKKVKSREIGYDNLPYKLVWKDGEGWTAAGNNVTMCKNTAFAKFPVIWLT